MEKNKMGFFDSVKTKLIAVMMLVTIIPLAVAIIVSYVTSTNKALADAQESLEWQARFVHSNFEKAVDVNLNMIRSIASNPTIVQFVLGEAEIPLDAVQATLYQYDQVMGDDQNTSITNDQGMQIARGTGECIDVSSRKRWQATYSSPMLLSAKQQEEE